MAALSKLRRSSQYPFLPVPREIRDMIYAYTLSSEDGLVYDCENHVFKDSEGEISGGAFELAFPEISHELAPPRIEFNTLIFTSQYVKGNSRSADAYHRYMRYIVEQKSQLLDGLAPLLLSHEMAQIGAEHHPEFKPVLDCWLQGKPLCPGRGRDLWPSQFYGEAPSLKRDFVHDMLDILIHSPNFSSTDLPLCTTLNHDEFRKLAAMNPDPWGVSIPAELPPLFQESRADTAYMNSRVEYTYSAAACAIQFIRGLTEYERKSLRKIVLVENHESVSLPQCHARGLIRYCREYEKLRIERRVGLFECILKTGGEFINSQAKMNWQCEAKSSAATKAISIWMSEAMLLPRLGMPHGSFTLVIDGGAPSRIPTIVFDRVLNDAVCQSTLKSSYTRQLEDAADSADDTESADAADLSYNFRARHSYWRWLERRTDLRYCSESIHDALQIISSGRNDALISCNFPLNEAPSEFEVRRLSFEEWRSYGPRCFETPSHLPAWGILKHNKVIREIERY